jgi:hypothetical protein
VVPPITETIVVPSGATITVAGDATVEWTDNGEEQPTVHVQFGKGIQVPPGSRISVMPGGAGTPAWMAIPNTGDLAVSAASKLTISGGSGALVIAEGDMLTDPAGQANPPAAAAHIRSQMSLTDHEAISQGEECPETSQRADDGNRTRMTSLEGSGYGRADECGCTSGGVSDCP